jgi:excinuclease ABC subunit C
MVVERSGSASVTDKLTEKLDGLPARPGVYLFKGADGQVLYVGKAKSLRSRVRSYFLAGNSDERPFLPRLVQEVEDLETIVVGTEKEAAILENSLIKEKQPRYNVKLRDDKEFLTLRLDPSRPWPRLDLVRRPARDRARYFGPYHSATSARRTLHLVNKHFQLRTCSDRELQSRSRPCLQYQIKRCAGPCVYEVDEQWYAEQVTRVTWFLEGRHDELTKQLRERMAEHAGALQFEQAAACRDQLQAVENLRAEQRVVAVADSDQDVVGIYREGDLVELSLLAVRAGRVVSVSSYSVPRVEADEQELVAAFLREQYHGETPSLVPDEILVPSLPDGVEGVEEWLSEGRTRGKRVKILAPERGPKRKLLELARENAEHAFREKQRADQDIQARLERIQMRLRLPTVPHRIECLDISHLGGQDAYGALVVVENGKPKPKDYRAFRVHPETPGDDYAAILEVLRRRFARGQKAEKGEAWALPDLLLVDGGRQQLAQAEAAAAELGLRDLALAGLAKERELAGGKQVIDRVYLPGQKNPVPLRPTSPELFILAMARDEAHRFSNYQRERAGLRRRLTSVLDEVPGIGAKSRIALLKQFADVEHVLEASDEELLAVPGINRRHVAALRQFSSQRPTRLETTVEDSTPETNEVETALDANSVDNYEAEMPTELSDGLNAV